ncbi:GT4 family glycosyltransferase PelF [Amantichitinum ursilacus]|uniref:GDP-mannose-dependent alpha-(1-6)-phosphatidylinositol monomannoside mannosyltransferase n=1 Tax=Amantichitinum ursilacus TaxID=857265 RepID=A0A0N0XKM6_9NEIS|nr:GT4 family glycosyltransferase PelF [Amantichitinum ursilacus]KPC52961.1 GDP-mannose-dependent alpha-(1-6)-phosphatidylinositol monomannoside mannosyltransferase [Amantichitinum ursilacus]
MKNSTLAELATAPPVDICLLLEGTFPYVSGGVSSWVNQMIRGFPELTFGIVFLGSRRSDYNEMKYAIPDNVKWLTEHYLHEHEPGTVHARPAARPGNKAQFANVRDAHAAFQAPHAPDTQPDAVRRMIGQLLAGTLSKDDFLYSEESWKVIRDQYRARSSDPSFVDYFWTIRAMHTPVWMLANLARSLPKAGAYHTVSTGYAGFLGAMLRQQTGRPLLLSEHGIYTKERKIDLYQSDWIRDNRNVFEREVTQISYFRALWIRFFEVLGKLCYDSADHIIALYETNRLRQIADGAPAERTINIPNGVDLPRLGPLRDLRPAEIPQVLCLIGRVVPIKDIKTFIRAMRTVVNQLPHAEAWIAGPEDESPEYAEECRNLATSLGLTEKVKFLGFQKITDLMPKVGVLILSSISEALPLVVLEGFAAGVPSITTDVGSCRQLIYGLSDEDQALGAAGRVVGVADAPALAHAAIELLGDPAAWTAAQEAGVARVTRYYTHAHMFGAYQSIYDQALAMPDTPGVIA